jgi:hypothetical protein
LSPRGPGSWGPNFIFLPEFLFILVRSPGKSLKPYDNPFWDFDNGGNKKKEKWKNKKGPPLFMPAAKGSASTPLGPIVPS